MTTCSKRNVRPRAVRVDGAQPDASVTAREAQDLRREVEASTPGLEPAGEGAGVRVHAADEAHALGAALAHDAVDAPERDHRPHHVRLGTAVRDGKAPAARGYR